MCIKAVDDYAMLSNLFVVEIKLNKCVIQLSPKILLCKYFIMINIKLNKCAVRQLICFLLHYTLFPIDLSQMKCFVCRRKDTLF